MSCEIARHLRETNDPALGDHLRSCPSCIVQDHARYYDAPAGLEQKIRASLRKEDRAPSNWRWLSIPAAVLVAFSVIFSWMLLNPRMNERHIMATNVLSAHIRSLQGNHLLDEPSSDQHNVKPWFNGKLDFAPDVKEVSGFPLLGGRLDYFDGHSAAALVYGRRDHKINLFTWPVAESIPEFAETVSGYHLQSWYRNGMAFWAVSDLNTEELGQFVSAYRGY
jgi:anti-sigma factor RsiW